MNPLPHIKGSYLLWLPSIIGLVLFALKICNHVPITWWVIWLAMLSPALIVLVLFVTGLLTYGIAYLHHLAKELKEKNQHN